MDGGGYGVEVQAREQMPVVGGLRPVGSGQWALGSGSVGSGLWALGSGLWAWALGWAGQAQTSTDHRMSWVTQKPASMLSTKNRFQPSLVASAVASVTRE